jgi:hypothetical protein
MKPSRKWPVKAVLLALLQHLDDLLYATGAALVAYGAYLVFVPAGFIVGGALMMTYGLIVARQLERRGAAKGR